MEEFLNINKIINKSQLVKSMWDRHPDDKDQLKHYKSQVQ